MLNQNPRQADFVLGTCPSCQKVVRIPVTAMTSQSKAQVTCPICEASFEIAEVLEETIPEVRVTEPNAAPRSTSDTQVDENSAGRPERINAIDTPELFHVSKDDYKPKTEKKNGRFVVPELLSKGIKKKRKKRRMRSRRRQSDPKLAESLAKLKQNTSVTSLQEATDSSSDGNNHANGKTKERSGERSKSRRRSRRESGASSSEQSVSFEKKDGGTKLKREKTFGNWLRSLQSQTKKSVQDFRTFGVGKPDSKFEFLLIGVGVLLAIPLLHVLLWWFVGIDPFGLSKPASRITPFLVPKAMRMKEPIVEEEPKPPAEPRRQTNVPDFEPPVRAQRDSSGKLPKPKIDPSSIHNNEDF